MERKVDKYPSGFTVESTLTMVGILRSKAGLLACNASNVIGSQQFAAKVFIHCKFLNIYFGFLKGHTDHVKNMYD